MNAASWVGLFCVAASCGQFLVPSRVYTQPTDFVLGLPVVPVVLLGFSAVLLTTGVILLGEGICKRLGAPSLWTAAVADPARFVRVLLGGAAAGLVMEVVAQWLGRLWIYPFWTVWLYALIVVPGFAFYWMSIVESYLAVKAVLDRLARPSRSVAPARPGGLLLIGVAALTTALLLYLNWYAQGYVLAVQHPTVHAPPFWYALIAFLGVWVTVEALLTRWGRPSLLGAMRRRYWTPLAAMVGASAVVGVLMEVQNAVHRFWAYQNWPGGWVAGVPVAVPTAWPLQYATFLVVPLLLAPELAVLFFTHPASAATTR
ncbi:MAG: hypothetical protein HOU81_06765 [Hamadaea sp.]|uniref:hypothetical protein n=1 Tax=Hamadaea sp. TaxID=2024425 RepID=UPI0017F77DDB|nr:hypothetical protein [Hamadaea sp.]NUR70503.1 hypothetical protein [Hamadaea sp.]NUT18110.1 hypothetical protein [Hamadaea sp.]